MRSCPSILVMAGLVACSAVSAQNHAASQVSGASLEALPRALEVKLALSAAPPYLRDGATGYLNEDFCNGLIVPECHDTEGSGTILPVEFNIERLRAEGKLRSAELKQEIARR